jgi:hypothetical protein
MVRAKDGLLSATSMKRLHDSLREETQGDCLDDNLEVVDMVGQEGIEGRTDTRTKDANSSMIPHSVVFQVHVNEPTRYFQGRIFTKSQ